MAIFVWDDGYGISVPRKYQTTKNSISDALAGMQWDERKGGINIYTVKGWDYPSLVQTIQQGIDRIRETHIPAIFHVQEVTQPQGHSTSGSHERYKSKERLEWEKEWDCISKMQEFILANNIATQDEINKIQDEAKEQARTSKQRAWDNFISPIKAQIQQAATVCNQVVFEGGEHAQQVAQIMQNLSAIKEPIRKDVMQALRKVLGLCKGDSPAVRTLRNHYNNLLQDNRDKFSSHLHSQSALSAMKVKEESPQFSEGSQVLNGYEVLNKFFDTTFANNPAVFAFGEDLGKIGDVNQGFAGLQDKYGELRITDTGIREATIIGQGLGMAMRGLRPIAEIQYLDYLLYGLQPLSDDVATMQYRTRGGQKCPLIVRTRGHRLEGIWHSGSPIGMIINSIRGMYLCVPRNMTQAAGMYNTLLQSDEPGIVIECLNGYRLKEKMPDNLSTYTVPFGVPEVMHEGADITVVSYGSTLRGASAYMFQQVMENQGGYKWLDVAPRTISAQAHRPAYATDGDYFSKPSAEDIAAIIEEMINE
jgi:pyruvate/2-oxoglutarate/acetoin dehydrogenase E1 component